MKLLQNKKKIGQQHNLLQILTLWEPKTSLLHHIPPCRLGAYNKG